MKRQVKITIEGPSGSCKNALSLRLAQQLAHYGVKVVVHADVDNVQLDPATIEEVHQGMAERIEVEIHTAFKEQPLNQKQGN